jgi:hypothetical protein
LQAPSAPPRLDSFFTLLPEPLACRFRRPPGTSGGTSASVAGENIIAYDLDRLFRSEQRPQGVDASISYPRSEAARILLTTSSHRGMQAEDRAYLLRLITAMTGLAPPDAERRVAEVIARAQENIARARATVVILGFMVGAAALLGAVAAWFAACAGGRQRDDRETLHPLWDWSQPFLEPDPQFSPRQTPCDAASVGAAIS